MSKIAFITDTHFGARNDSPLFVEYFLSFLEGQFFPYLKENNIKTVIHLGDLMDRRKYVNFYVLSQVKSKFMDYLKKNNHGSTRIFIIYSNQTFPEYDSSKILNNETDKLYYLSLKNLKVIVTDKNKRQHNIVDKNFTRR